MTLTFLLYFQSLLAFTILFLTTEFQSRSLRHLSTQRTPLKSMLQKVPLNPQFTIMFTNVDMKCNPDVVKRPQF